MPEENVGALRRPELGSPVQTLGHWIRSLLNSYREMTRSDLRPLWALLHAEG